MGLPSAMNKGSFSTTGENLPRTANRGFVGRDNALPVHVLHVAETLTGGIASYFEEMIPAQCARLGSAGVAVLVPAAHADQIEGLGQGHTFAFPGPDSRAWRTFMLFWAFLFLCFKVRPRVVHAHSTMAGVVARFANVLLLGRLKVVYCAHGWAWDRKSSPMSAKLVTWAEKRLARYCDAIVCISRHDYEGALKTGMKVERLKLISNGIGDQAPMSEEDQLFASQLRHRRLLFVGRFDEQKGIDIFLSSMKDLENEVDAYAVGGYVVDSGSNLDMPRNVAHVGWVTRSRVAAYMSRVDALVVPSRWEGFGLVATEAMRAGLPVIASRVGGLQDLVEDGVTGFLFDVNEPGALTHALRRALNADLKHMGERGRERFMTHFRSESMNQELLRLYASLDQ